MCRRGVGTFTKLGAQDVVRFDSRRVRASVVAHGATDNHDSALLIFLTRFGRYVFMPTS
jgi:hypothetical protein